MQYYAVIMISTHKIIIGEAMPYYSPTFDKMGISLKTALFYFDRKMIEMMPISPIYSSYIDQMGMGIVGVPDIYPTIIRSKNIKIGTQNQTTKYVTSTKNNN